MKHYIFIKIFKHFVSGLQMVILTFGYIRHLLPMQVIFPHYDYINLKLKSQCFH